MSILVLPLENMLLGILRDIRNQMVLRFTPYVPYAELQKILIPDIDERELLQRAGLHMKEQNMYYRYGIGNVTVNFECEGGEEMPVILFPAAVSIDSDEFLDLIRPLYIITKTWDDVIAAFVVVCDIVQDVRELNFFVPWLKHIIPDKEFDNPYNGKWEVSRWLGLSEAKKTRIDQAQVQIHAITNSLQTNKRTWMPAKLVHIARQGDELITQYNLLKNSKKVEPDYDSKVKITMTISNDNKIANLAAEAKAHHNMNEALKLKERGL